MNLSRFNCNVKVIYFETTKENKLSNFVKFKMEI